jgi:pectinesterase
MVDGYFARPREDYAWENDRIAFRMYGPALAAEVNNGIDVWTKRVRSLIVRKWYAEDEKEGKGNYYHTDRGEGADFFAVGKTLGAGGSGIWYHDSLYQPGVFTSYRTIANGPIRTTFELLYETWNVHGKTFTETKRISLDAGHNLNRIEVRITGAAPQDSFLVACGLVKRKGVTVSGDERRGWLALWGPTNGDPVNGSLGTGVLVLASTVAGKHEDSVQVLLLGRLTAGQPFTYWAGAGWSRSGNFSDAAAWDRYLREASTTVAEPLRVSIKPEAH